MSRSIEQIVYDIRNAIYGQQVRTAIADGIETCYSDVSESRTTASDAADYARTAGELANHYAAEAYARLTSFQAEIKSVGTLLERAQAYQNRVYEYRNNAYSYANNAQGYSNDALIYRNLAEEYNQAASAHSTSAKDAKTQSETFANNAFQYMSSALAYSINSESSKTNAENYKNDAQQSMLSAKAYMNDAYTYASNASSASDYMDSAYRYMNDAYTYASSAVGAKSSEENAYRYMMSASTYSENAASAKEASEIYRNQAYSYASDANLAKSNAENYKNDAQQSMSSAMAYMNDAYTYASNASSASDYMSSAYRYMNDAYIYASSAVGAKEAKEYAEEYMLNAYTYMNSALDSADRAEASEESASTSYNGALIYMGMAYGYFASAYAAADRAENATQSLDDAIAYANNAGAVANAAANSANMATSTFESMQTALSALKSTIETSTVPNANSATISAREARDNVLQAVTILNDYIERASSQTDDLGSIIDSWNNRYAVDFARAYSRAQSSADYAYSAGQSINNLSVTSESITEGVSTASITEVEDAGGGTHKNIHFAIRKGDKGESYIVRGHAYDSLEDLDEDITDPNVGDLYNVGSEPPYNVYRWTGSSWENQGIIGLGVTSLTLEDINAIYGDDPISGDPGKYLNFTGMLHSVRDILLPMLNGKVDAVDGKGLSSNDFTNDDKASLGLLAADVDALWVEKVNVVGGKGLSTNDFTNAYKTQIGTNTSNIAAINSALAYKLNADFEAYPSIPNTSDGYTYLSGGLFPVLSSGESKSVNGSTVLQWLISAGTLLTSSNVATTTETSNYLGIV